MDFQNKTVVITGASSGIGYALSAELVALGAKVYSISRSLPEVKVESVIYLQADLTQEDQVAKVAEQISSVDVLVNNAGMMKRGKFFEISAAEFDQVWAIDVKGMWLVFKYLWKKLKPSAMTVQVNSKNARSVKADTFIYTLSKVADLTIDQLVAQERPDLDMRVAYFGPVDTALEWTGYSVEKKAEKMKIALTKEEAAKLLVDLLNSDQKNLFYQDATNDYLIAN